MSSYQLHIFRGSWTIALTSICLSILLWALSQQALSSRCQLISGRSSDPGRPYQHQQYRNSILKHPQRLPHQTTSTAMPSLCSTPLMFSRSFPRHTRLMGPPSRRRYNLNIQIPKHSNSHNIRPQPHHPCILNEIHRTSINPEYRDRGSTRGTHHE